MGQTEKSLTAIHGLAQNKHTLLEGAIEFGECLSKQALRSIRALVLVEEIRWVDLVLHQVGQVENDVATSTVECALSGWQSCLRLFTRGLLLS